MNVKEDVRGEEGRTSSRAISSLEKVSPGIKPLFVSSKLTIIEVKIMRSVKKDVKELPFSEPKDGTESTGEEYSFHTCECNQTLSE